MSRKPDPSAAEKIDHGVLDPTDPDHALPEGLERKRKGPLNPRTGRRPETGSVENQKN